MEEDANLVTNQPRRILVLPKWCWSGPNAWWKKDVT